MKCPDAVVLAGRRIELQNCLPRDKEQWSIELAKLLAEVNGIKFTETVKKVVEYVRSFGRHMASVRRSRSWSQTSA